MPDYEYHSFQLRRDFSLAKVFEEHHLQKLLNVCETMNDEKGDKSLVLSLSRMDEDSVSDYLRSYINPNEYVGLIGSITITDRKTKNNIEIYMPHDPENILSIWFNGDNVNQMHQDKVSLKDFTPQYIEKIARYLLSNYRRSFAPSLKVARDRHDVKKEIKIFSIVGGIFGVFLMFKISFMAGLVVFSLIELFLNFYYPKLDIRK